MITTDDARVFFSAMSRRFDRERDRLNALDAEVGDGDHGSTMSRACTAVAQATDGSFDNLGDLFDAASEAFATAAGGAIGPLFSAFFAEGGLLFRGRTTVDGPEYVQFLANGLKAIVDVGRAERGEKTIVDALAPAVDEAQRRSGDSPVSIAEAVSRAAFNGAQATCSMKANHGRARFLGERSVGYQDAGATSMALVLETLHEVLSRTAAGTNDERGTGLPPSSARRTGGLPPTGARPPGGLPPSGARRTAGRPVPGKFINNPDSVIDEELEGLSCAFADRVVRAAPDILVRAHPKPDGRVGLAVGHGGGHSPSMGGFVGPGLLDADAYGPVFTCAPGTRIAEAIRHADRGAGVVLAVSNHTGDVLNARVAVRRAEQLGIRVETVLCGDDVATAPRDRLDERRGLGGILFAVKIAGACAEHGASIDEVASLMRSVNERTATLMVAATPPHNLTTGEPLFALPEGTIEVGAGVHGEAGVYRGEHLFADPLVDMMLDRLVPDIEPLAGGPVLVFLNGAGATSLVELHILYRRVHTNLEERGLEIGGVVIGSFFTTQDMGGFSLSLCAPTNEQLALWREPAYGPYFVHYPDGRSLFQ